MSEEYDKIGDLFRNTLKDHRLDSDASLWDRLENQLSIQTPVSVPKTSFIQHLTWLKVAVAASVIISAALAFNFIYLPLKNSKSISDINKTIDNNKPTVSIKDSSSVESKLQNQRINHLESKDNLIRNSKYPELIQKLNRNPLINKSDEKNSSANNNLLTNYTNNTQPVNQPNNSIVNTQQTKVNNNSNAQNNNADKVIPKKDSIRQAVNDIDIDKNQISSYQNIAANQDLQKNEDVISNNDIPNFITPNNDGINDYFVIKNIEKCSNNHLIIKDRNGNVVFEKLNYQNDWDGKNVADGVYFYFLKYNSSNNNLGKMGSITIKR